jgi:hypothetical protein
MEPSFAPSVRKVELGEARCAGVVLRHLVYVGRYVMLPHLSFAVASRLAYRGRCRPEFCNKEAASAVPCKEVYKECQMRGPVLDTNGAENASLGRDIIHFN